MAKASDNQFPKLVLTEQGSTPSNPAAGDQKLFVRDSDHHVCRVNSDGAVKDIERSFKPCSPSRAIWRQAPSRYASTTQ